MKEVSRQLSFLASRRSWRFLGSQLGAVGGDLSAGRGLKLVVGGWILMLAGTVWLVFRLPPQIPFHYARPWGELQLVDRKGVWWLVGSMTAVIVVNTGLAVGFFERARLLSRVVIWSTVLLVFLSLLVLATVWLRVGR